jgi:ABC-type long-subunit fatty acid transport system fused permease/ATPase subunit
MLTKTKQFYELNGGVRRRDVYTQIFLKYRYFNLWFLFPRQMKYIMEGKERRENSNDSR